MVAYAMHARDPRQNRSYRQRFPVPFRPRPSPTLRACSRVPYVGAPTQALQAFASGRLPAYRYGAA